jgi:hypothetical protein
MTMKNKILAFAVGLYMALMIVSVTPAAHAIVVTDFGSILVSTIPCTCSGALYMVTLQNGTYRPKTLTFMPGVSALKLDYNIMTPGVQLLGQHTVDTGWCWMYKGTSCVLLPAEGFILPSPYQGVGTSGAPVM